MIITKKTDNEKDMKNENSATNPICANRNKSPLLFSSAEMFK